MLAAFSSLFRRKSQSITVSSITFIGEQDGPPERTLKDAWRIAFPNFHSLCDAYLAQVRYSGSDEVHVCLCLKVTSGPDIALRDTATKIFQRDFRKDVHLDIVFLSDEQHEKVALVCHPFYTKKNG